MCIPIWISNRHIHLSQADADVLFGENYIFTAPKELSQPWQYAYNETVTITGTKGSLHKIRVLWPCRNETQIEVSLTDTFALGISAPIRISGDLDWTPGLTVVGPQGEVQLSRGVIVAQRHLHISPSQAKELWLVDKQTIKIKVSGSRALVFDEVSVRVNERYALDCHIDTDEANAGALSMWAFWEIVI